MRRWFIPSWSGDFRLEAADDDKCLLTVEDPIPAEVEQLGKFLVKARKKKWCADIAGISPEGKSTLEIGAPVDRAGKVLLGRKRPRKGILTCIKSEGGGLVAIKGDGEELEIAAAAPAATEAATVRRPTLCCPHATTGPDLRASKVLQAFCTNEQWRSWVNLGFLYCNGNLSGRRYLVAHRHHPLAIQNKYILWDCTGDHVIHCWDWSVPPPEEVLAVKLAVEHAEEWVRNASSVFNGLKDVYHNPFMPDRGQHLDGLLSTGIARGFGKLMMALGLKPKPRLPRRRLGDVGEVEHHTFDDDGGWVSDFDYDGTPLPKGIRRKESYR
jgi:hypothetical protein